ncbi:MULTISPECIES: hypothetical protein [unclassified Streptomyces]|uniref:hypothetical protein n=1 Tax=unclassified Streptomyces TaxID=2593676 RepID=UPI003328F8E3
MPVPLPRAATLHDLLPLGYQLTPEDSDPARVWASAPDLPGPVHGIGPADGPFSAAWCPACLEPLDNYTFDWFYADHGIYPSAHIGTLLTLSCGHAFRVRRGQSVLEIREPVA